MEANRSYYLKFDKPTRNPSGDTLYKFLKSTGIDKIPYVSGDFMCMDYAVAVYYAAQKAGVRGGIATIKFRKGEYGHCVNVFNVRKPGLVFIDSAWRTYEDSDDVPESNVNLVNVKVGKPLDWVNIDGDFGRCVFSDDIDEDIVKNVEIIW